MKFKSVIIIFAVLFIQSCIPSLHPLWTQDKLVFDENLLGEWNEKKSEGVSNWQFSGGFDEKKKLVASYKLTQNLNQAKASFDIHLVKLGEHLFFDMLPDNLETLKFGDKTLGVPFDISGFGNEEQKQPDIPLNILYFQHMLPVHTFAKVEIESDEVRIFRFDTEWLDKLFKERKVRIKHEKTGDGQIVLTASTEDLQKFVEKYADDPKAFIDPIILQRN